MKSIEERLREINWNTLEHAYGSAEECLIY